MLCRNARCRRNIPADAAAIRFQSSKGSRKPRRPPGHGSGNASGNASERPLRPKRFAARSCRRPGPEVSGNRPPPDDLRSAPKGLLRFQVSPAARFPMFRYFATGRVPLSLPKTKETYGTQDRNILRELDRNDPIPRGTDCPENGRFQSRYARCSGRGSRYYRRLRLSAARIVHMGRRRPAGRLVRFSRQDQDARTCPASTVALFGCGDSEFLPRHVLQRARHDLRRASAYRLPVRRRIRAAGLRGDRLGRMPRRKVRGTGRRRDSTRTTRPPRGPTAGSKR